MNVFRHAAASMAIVGLLCLGMSPSHSAEEKVAPEQSHPVDIGSRRELFVDDLLIDRLDNTQLKLHEPVSGGVAIRIDKPWEGVTFGGSVLHHRGRYLLYYSASPVEDDVDALCVATSEDGKPIPGFAVDDCLEIIGDEITRTVAWKNGEDLSSLAGRPVRLRFVMHDADLYALRFE